MSKDRPNKMREFMRILVPMLAHVQPQVIVYERPFCRGLPATRMLWGFAGIIEGLGCEYAAVLDQVPGPIKKWATGSGNADKQAMIDASKAMGYDPANDHEADVYLLARYTQANVISEGDLKDE